MELAPRQVEDEGKLAPGLNENLNKGCRLCTLSSSQGLPSVLCRCCGHTLLDAFPCVRLTAAQALLCIS